MVETRMLPNHLNLKVLLTYFVLLFLIPGSLLAQADQNVSLQQSLKKWHANIEQTISQMERSDLKDETLKRVRKELIEMREQIRSAREEFDLSKEPLQDELNALGAPPGEGQPKESKTIATQRKKLNEQIADIEVQVKEADLILAKVEKLLKQLSVVRIDQFANKLFSRNVSALSPDIWQKAITSLQKKLLLTTAQFENWYSKELTSQTIKSFSFHLSMVLLVSFLIVLPFSIWFSRKYGYDAKVETPSYVELLRAALTVTFIRTLIPIILFVSVYHVLGTDFQWSKTTGDIAFSILQALLLMALVTAVSHALLSPSNPRWQLIPLDNNNAHYIQNLILLLTGVFAFDRVLETWSSTIGVRSLELTIALNFLIGLLISGLLIALILPQRLWQTDIDQQNKQRGGFGVLSSFRGWVAVFILMIPISAMVGYAALSRFLSTQIVLTGVLCLMTGVIIVFCTKLIEELLNKETAIGSKIWKNLELTDEGGEFLIFWVKIAVSVIIYLSAFLSLLVIWGAGGEDLNEWLYNALFGFNIGNITVSIATVFFAIALFSGILLTTRLLQNFLEKSIFPKTRIDLGIQNSLRAALGYIGFITAVLLAISTLGIDLTKLAFIAGALSLGIGFGLQNVVNNFVSGLILLIERPIKVGDWVVVGDKQGYVKKIKVRATEIQTFDRASVFVPNSDLISHPLLNWTHADKTGRVIVPVGVAYG